MRCQTHSERADSPLAPSRPWRGEVRFEGVRFGYRGDPDVLAGLDLTIPAGQTVAVVGRTGAGKTTVARLLARLWDPHEGDVLVDDVPLRELTEEQLRRAVTMVTQESFLFRGSVSVRTGGLGAWGRTPPSGHGRAVRTPWRGGRPPCASTATASPIDAPRRTERSTNRPSSRAT